MSQIANRRRFLGGAVLATAASVAPPRASALAVPSNLVHVGATRDFRTVQAALTSIRNASADNRYLILVDPGTYDIASGGGPIVMQRYVSIAGADRSSVVFIASDADNFRCNSYADISDLTIHYSGIGEPWGAITSFIHELEDVHLSRLYIHVDGPNPAFNARRYVRRMEIRDATIVTQGIGINVEAGGFLYCHDNNIHLFGTTGAPHIGIRASGYCRIYVFGGKIGTGYGYGQVEDPGMDVIGLLANPSQRGVIVMHGVWSICRNDQALPNTIVNCVRITGEQGWVRVFACYLQAEEQELSPAIENPGNGRLEIYGTRVRLYGEGPVYSTNQIGLSRFTQADNNAALTEAVGGLILLDASDGPFRLVLPGLPRTTEQLIFKKVDATNNAITLDGNNLLIDGAERRTLTAPYQTLHLRFGGDQFYIVG